MRSCEKLRELLAKPGLIQLPGCYDCITAMIAVKAGFPAIYLSGAGISFTITGHPDVNTISYAEVRQVVENIRNEVTVPMVVDIDTGFGGPLNIYRLVKEFDLLDIAAIQIEDQKAPKKCGHELGRVVVSPEEMTQRIKAVCDTRANGNKGMVVIARTDSRTGLGIDEAIRRSNIYLEAGADIIFLESPESYEEVQRITKEVKGPVLYNNVEGGRSPFLTKEQLETVGAKLTIYPNSMTRVVAKECMRLMETLKETGSTLPMANNMMNHKELWGMFDAEGWYALEKKYSSPK